jgi:hypothetical protein
LHALADDVAGNARRGEIEMSELDMRSVTVWIELLMEGDPESAARQLNCCNKGRYSTVLE